MTYRHGLWAIALTLFFVRPALASTVYVATVSDAIGPAISDYLDKAIKAADEAGADLLVLELDTPGGLLTTTKDIVSSILNAPLPVAVFVSPRGAWAASAGTFITMAGHIAAMAPGTSIGAAHPVSSFGSNPKPPTVPKEDGEEGEEPAQGGATDFAAEKAENFTVAFIESIAEERERNVEWAVDAVRNSVAIKQSEALEKNVIDLVAEDLDHLLEQLHGRVVKVGRGEVVLDTENAQVHYFEMDLINRIFAVIGNPSVAFLLFLAGAAGLYIEVQNPGLIVPGSIGVVCLILAGLALQIIPFNWIGLILILAGLGLLVAEIFITSFGVLFALGISCFAAGAYLVFRVPELSDLAVPVVSVILPTVLVLAGFMGIVIYGVSKSFQRPQFAGVESLIGQQAVADSDSDAAGRGRVLVRGELWTAESDSQIREGDRVEIVEVQDLVVRVRPVAATSSDSA
ncbi:MAG: nodulation protein NfeD [bacterium]|nr:nodulation protein NfeD [bacterium]